MGRVESSTNPQAGSTHARPGDHPNGTSKPDEAIKGRGESRLPGCEIHESVPRHFRIRARAPAAAQEVHRQHEVADETDRAFPAGQTPREANPFVPEAGADEIILFESAESSDSRTDSTHENVDGILFIE